MSRVATRHTPRIAGLARGAGRIRLTCQNGHTSVGAKLAAKAAMPFVTLKGLVKRVMFARYLRSVVSKSLYGMI